MAIDSGNVVVGTTTAPLSSSVTTNVATLQPTAEDWKAKYEEMRKHSREWEKKARANQAAADELQKLDEASKSELEKAQAARKKAEDELAALKASTELDRARAKVASETGVPAEFIVGEDEDAMRGYAEKLAKHFRPDPAPKVPGAGKIPRNAASSDPDEGKRELARMMFGNGQE